MAQRSLRSTTRPRHFAWAAASINGVSVDTARLPTWLPYTGVLVLDFVVSDAIKRSTPPQPMALSLQLCRPCHKAIYEQFQKLRAVSGGAELPEQSKAGTVHIRPLPPRALTSLEAADRRELGDTVGAFEVEVVDVDV